MKVAIFGLGYVGTVTAAGLASRGHEVVGVDVDVRKVAAINRGESPVVEPGVDRMVAQAVCMGRLRATTDVVDALEQADVSLVCVGTPSTSRGATDLTYISRALADLRTAMADATPPPSGFHSVVIRSTVPPEPGTRSWSRPSGRSCCPMGGPSARRCVRSSSARGPGSRTSSRPPLVVVGSGDPRTRESCAHLFDFLDREVRHVDVRTAEALKYACNAFHAVKVTFANEMGRIFSSTAWTRGRSWRSSARTISSTSRRPTCGRGSPSAVRASPRTCGRSRTWRGRAASTCRSSAPLWSATRSLVRALVDRVLETGLPPRRHPRAQLQDEHRRPAREPQPRGRGAPRRQGPRRFASTTPSSTPPSSSAPTWSIYASKLPHVSRLLVDRPEQALEGAEVVIVATSEPATLAALEAADPMLVLDIHGRLGEQVEHLAGYQGVSW